MPDVDRTNPSVPAGWSDAFAALPMETPPADGWQRLTRSLDGPSRSRARDRRHRWPLWLAAAAAMSAVALVPVLMRDPPPTATAPVAGTTTRSPSNASDAAPLPATVPAITDTAPSQAADVAMDAIAKAPSIAPRKRRPSPTAPPHEVEPRRLVAVEDAPAAAAAATGMTDLSALQAESAQLEALVALARDDRVASAGSAALTVELDERIGRIDASLSQPTLGDAERAALWQERVEAMREMAGIETTRRWLTASGERYDGALVSVD